MALLRGGKGLPAGGWSAVEKKAHVTIGRIVQAIGERSFAIGGDVSGSIIIPGDRNKITREADPEGWSSWMVAIVPRRVAAGRRKGLRRRNRVAKYSADASLPRVYPVWYGTNRSYRDSSDPSAGYSGDRESQERRSLREMSGRDPQVAPVRFGRLRLVEALAHLDR